MGLQRERHSKTNSAGPAGSSLTCTACSSLPLARAGWGCGRRLPLEYRQLELHRRTLLREHSCLELLTCFLLLLLLLLPALLQRQGQR